MKRRLVAPIGVAPSLDRPFPSLANSGKPAMDNVSPAQPTQAELDALDEILNFVVDYVQWQPGDDDEKKELLGKMNHVNSLMTKVERSETTWRTGGGFGRRQIVRSRRTLRCLSLGAPLGPWRIACCLQALFRNLTVVTRQLNAHVTPAVPQRHDAGR